MRVYRTLGTQGWLMNNGDPTTAPPSHLLTRIFAMCVQVTDNHKTSARPTTARPRTSGSRTSPD